MKYIITTIISVFLSTAIFLFGFTYDSPLSRFVDSLMFGAISYPASLDTFTNPSGTDSVATVSHSSQHSNANDAIEAIEAKVGITASTPVTGSILVGDGTGTSRWSTYATTTSLFTTLFESTNILASGSSTLQNFTFVNATGTSATTTNFFATTASTTNFFGAGLLGAGCNGSNFVQYDGSGKFECGSPSTGVVVASTTQFIAQTLSTTTGMTAGQSAFVAVSFTINSTAAAGLFAKEPGQATSTLQAVTGANGDGAATTWSLIGTFTSQSANLIEFYVGTDINTYYTQSGGQKGNISIIKF